MSEEQTTEVPIKCLMLNGCATSGSAHLGFLWSLENRRLTGNVNIVSGTSIGSIIGVLYCLGLTPKEILTEYENKNFVDLLNFGSSINNGISEPDGILADLVDIFIKYNYNPEVTFAELLEATGKEFVVNATRVFEHKLVPAHFSAKTTPTLKVLTAIRMSINIPFLFNIQEMHGGVYCDGVFTCDLPFSHLAKEYSLAPEEILAHCVRNVTNRQEGGGRTKETEEEEDEADPSILLMQQQHSSSTSQIPQDRDKLSFLTLFRIFIDHYIAIGSTDPENKKYTKRIVSTNVKISSPFLLQIKVTKGFVHAAWLEGIESTNRALKKFKYAVGDSSESKGV